MAPALNLNPFAIVVAGVFVVVLIALYVARRNISRNQPPTPMFARRWSDPREGVGEKPILVDLVVEKGVGRGWRDFTVSVLINGGARRMIIDSRC